MGTVEHYVIMLLVSIFGPLLWVVHRNAADQRDRMEARFQRLLENHERIGWHEPMGVRMADIERRVAMLEQRDQ